MLTVFDRVMVDTLKHGMQSGVVIGIETIYCGHVDTLRTPKQYLDFLKKPRNSQYLHVRYIVKLDDNDLYGFAPCFQRDKLTSV